MERAQILRESFNSFEPRIFLDLENIGVVE